MSRRTSEAVVRHYDFDEVEGILPVGAISRNDWEHPEAAWLHDMPWEEAAREAAQLTPEDIRFYELVGNTEGYTPYYAKYAEAAGNRSPEEITFADSIWKPQEHVHDLVAHSVVDMGAGRTHSTREASLERAGANMSRGRRIGSELLRQAGGRISPDFLRILTYLKGVPNEHLAGFTWQFAGDNLHERGLTHLAELFRTPQAQEPRHAEQYAQFASELLENHPLLRKIARKVLAEDKGAVGDEFRTASDTRFMRRYLHSIAGDRFGRRAELADRLFQKIPGMKDLTPSQDRINKLAA